MDNENKKETIGDKVKNKLKNSVNIYIEEKIYTLCGMGRELRLRADQESEEYLELKSKHDKLEARVKRLQSYLDGTYKAENLAKAATKAKEKREATISGPKSKSKKLGEQLEALEFKREEEIQQLKELEELEVRMNMVNLLAEDEVKQRAEEWKIHNEIVKHSLSLRKINARIAMTKIRKSSQDAKDVEKMRQAIDKYNEKITEYNKKIEKANEDRPKDIVEEFMRQNDWILGEVTIDREKRIDEIVKSTDESNKSRRAEQQEEYSKKAQQENSNLPYKEIDDNTRNELIVYSEKITTFKEMTEFLKIKAARVAGKAAGFAILAARRMKSMSKVAAEKIKSIPAALEAKIEHSSEVQDTDVGESKPTNNIINLGKKKIDEKQTEPNPKKEKKSRKGTKPIEKPAEEQKTFMETVKAAMEKTVNRLELDKKQELESSIQPSIKAQSSSVENKEAEVTPAKATTVRVTPVKVTPVKVTPAKATPVKVTPVKVTPIKASVAVDNNVKRAVEMVGQNHGKNQGNLQSTKSNREDDFTWGEDSETK